MEKRNDPIVGAVTTGASGHAERLAALMLIEPLRRRSRSPTTKTQSTSARHSAIDDGHTTYHTGYGLCHGNEGGVEKGQGLIGSHAASATASNHALPLRL